MVLTKLICDINSLLFLMSCVIMTLLVEAVVSKVKSEDLNIEEICLSCGGKSQEQHPLFEGGVCDDCKVSFPMVEAS